MPRFSPRPFYGSLTNFNAGAKVQCGDAASVQLTTAAVMVWFRLGTDNTPSNYHAVVSKDFAYAIYIKNNLLESYDWTASADRVTTFRTDDDKWHLAVLNLKSGVANGSSISMDGLPYQNFTLTVLNQNNNLTIGNQDTGGTQFNLSSPGGIGETSVFNRNLSITEAQDYYYRGVFPASGCVARYSMTDNTGTTVTDSVGTNNGTITNALWSKDAPPCASRLLQPYEAPAELLGATLWLRADYGITMATGVSSWADVRGNGIALTQAGTTLQPALVTQQNGLPAVRFDGSNDYLKGLFANALPNTMFLVHQAVTRGAAGVNDFVTDGGTPATYTIGENNSPSLSVYLSGVLSTTNPYAIKTYYGITLIANGANTTIRTNGSVLITGSAGVNSVPGGLTLAAQADGTRPTNIEIAEVIILPGVASNATIVAVEEYLRKRYSLY